MEQIANLQIEKLSEGVYLATSDDIPGLVAQGRTVTETIEIALDVAKKLLEPQANYKHRKSGSAKGQIWMSPDFDEPLTHFEPDM